MRPEFSARIARLQEAMAREAIDLVILPPGTNLKYIAGITLLADERPAALLVGRDTLRMVVPALNAAEAASQTDLALLTWTDEDGPRAAIEEAARGLGAAAVVAVDGPGRADTVIPFADVFHPHHLTLAGGVLESLRIRKTPAEIDLLKAAAAQADRVMGVGLAACRAGAAESEIGWEIESAFRKDGAEMVDFVIVGSGPNSAFPHHHTGSRRLEAGDAVVLDIGATLAGYKSDITRMVHLGKPDAEFTRVYDAVLTANERGRAAARPGARASDVDRAARAALEERGLAEWFTHRTGHGLGMDGHEAPYMSATSGTVLEPGMVFSVEPGVYLPGKFGVRIEDIVVVTERGSVTLNEAPRELALG